MKVTGMNASTGKPMEDMEHIVQSIRDILTTRLGTRCMRRHYGSIVPELIDQPTHQATQLRLQAASVMAIMRWEPRVLITWTQFAIDMAGKGVLEFDGVRRDGPRAGRPFNFRVPIAS
jgi:phage baseplate assembly protein W